MRSFKLVAWAGAAVWIGLVLARGRFWDARADGLREPVPGAAAPDVHAVVPARNEGDVVARTLASLLAQRYSGRFDITLVDDRSDDGTGAIARKIARARIGPAGAQVVEARPRPEGWSGKVWAMSEGVASARGAGARPAYWWFTDADVEHDPDTLARLVATAEAGRRDLVSQMVELHCGSAWERLLVPAFVYFFRMLYPFAWINDDRRSTAGAAGGSVLIAAAALTRIGGVARIAGELIDDCALAAAVKGDGGGIFLGLTTRSRSVRPYAGLGAIWDMVARTAYTQLGRSPLLLAATVAGMAVLYVVPPAAAIGGVAARRPDLALPGTVAWAVMTLSYLPTIRLYGLGRRHALALPFAGVLYTAMTIDSAVRHRRGRGGMWKGRGFTPAPDRS